MLVTGRKLPIGIQTFEDIRNDGYLYVDKTALMWTMANIGKPFFLSRPRRFGKSLLISTFEAYFKGRRDLFTGLAVEQLEKKWEEYPVLHLDLNAEKYDSPDRLDAILSNQLTQWEAIYGRGEDETTLSSRFLGVIRRASEQAGRGVVVLVDEYDKPLLQAIQNEPLLNSYRSTLKAFYGVLKSADRYLRFAFLTGVTKFSQVSVFSDLNQLNDISLNYDFSTLCGITREELLANFEPEIELLKESDYDLRLLMDGIETAASAFTEYRADRKNPIPLIYQSGYLTIKDYDREFRLYRLGFPNDEVRYGFLNFLLPFYTAVTDEERSFYIGKFVQELRTGNVDAFMHRFEAFFADFPYELNDQTERHYQVIIYLIFKLMGQFTQAEVYSSRGRADAVVRTPKFIYIFEFKLNGTVEQAMEQIEEKGYAFPYTAEDQQVIKVGVEFSAEKRNVERWMVAKEI